MKVEPLSVASTASLTAGADDFSSQQVYVQNTASAIRYVHIETGTSGTRYSSIVLQANSNVIVRKNYSDQIFASTAAANFSAYSSF